MALWLLRQLRRQDISPLNIRAVLRAVGRHAIVMGVVYAVTLSIAMAVAQVVTMRVLALNAPTDSRIGLVVWLFLWSETECTTMMWHDGDVWTWVGWVLMSVSMVAFWALVITAVVLAIRCLASPRGTAASPSILGQTRAEDVLAERFARGEIDSEWYRHRLKLLRQQR